MRIEHQVAVASAYPFCPVPPCSLVVLLHKPGFEPRRGRYFLVFLRPHAQLPLVACLRLERLPGVCYVERAVARNLAGIPQARAVLAVNPQAVGFLPHAVFEFAGRHLPAETRPRGVYTEGTCRIFHFQPFQPGCGHTQPLHTANQHQEERFSLHNGTICAAGQFTGTINNLVFTVLKQNTAVHREFPKPGHAA